MVVDDGDLEEFGLADERGGAGAESREWFRDVPSVSVPGVYCEEPYLSLGNARFDERSEETRKNAERFHKLMVEVAQAGIQNFAASLGVDTAGLRAARQAAKTQNFGEIPNAAGGRLLTAEELEHLARLR